MKLFLVLSAVLYASAINIPRNLEEKGVEGNKNNDKEKGVGGNKDKNKEKGVAKPEPVAVPNSFTSDGRKARQVYEEGCMALFKEQNEKKVSMVPPRACIEDFVFDLGGLTVSAFLTKLVVEFNSVTECGDMTTLGFKPECKTSFRTQMFDGFKALETNKKGFGTCLITPKKDQTVICKQLNNEVLKLSRRISFTIENLLKEGSFSKLTDKEKKEQPQGTVSKAILNIANEFAGKNNGCASGVKKACEDAIRKDLEGSDVFAALTKEQKDIGINRAVREEGDAATTKQFRKCTINKMAKLSPSATTTCQTYSTAANECSNGKREIQQLCFKKAVSSAIDCVFGHVDFQTKDFTDHDENCFEDTLTDLEGCGLCRKNHNKGFASLDAVKSLWVEACEEVKERKDDKEAALLFDTDCDTSAYKLGSWVQAKVPKTRDAGEIKADKVKRKVLTLATNAIALLDAEQEKNKDKPDKEKWIANKKAIVATIKASRDSGESKATVARILRDVIAQKRNDGAVGVGVEAVIDTSILHNCDGSNKDDGSGVPGFGCTLNLWKAGDVEESWTGLDLIPNSKTITDKEACKTFCDPDPECVACLVQVIVEASPTFRAVSSIETFSPCDKADKNGAKTTCSQNVELQFAYYGNEPVIRTTKRTYDSGKKEIAKLSKQLGLPPYQVALSLKNADSDKLRTIAKATLSGTTDETEAQDKIKSLLEEDEDDDEDVNARFSKHREKAAALFVSIESMDGFTKAKKEELEEFAIKKAYAVSDDAWSDQKIKRKLKKLKTQVVNQDKYLTIVSDMENALSDDGAVTTKEGRRKIFREALDSIDDTLYKDSKTVVNKVFGDDKRGRSLKAVGESIGQNLAECLILSNATKEGKEECKRDAATEKGETLGDDFPSVLINKLAMQICLDSKADDKNFPPNATCLGSEVKEEFLTKKFKIDERIDYILNTDEYVYGEDTVAKDLPTTLEKKATGTTQLIRKVCGLLKKLKTVDKELGNEATNGDDLELALKLNAKLSKDYGKNEIKFNKEQFELTGLSSGAMDELVDVISSGSTDKAALKERRDKSVQINKANGEPAPRGIINVARVRAVVERFVYMEQIDAKTIIGNISATLTDNAYFEKVMEVLDTTEAKVIMEKIQTDLGLKDAYDEPLDIEKAARLVVTMRGDEDRVVFPKIDNDTIRSYFKWSDSMEDAKKEVKAVLGEMKLDRSVECKVYDETSDEEMVACKITRKRTSGDTTPEARMPEKDKKDFIEKLGVKITAKGAKAKGEGRRRRLASGDVVVEVEYEVVEDYNNDGFVYQRKPANGENNKYNGATQSAVPWSIGVVVLLLTVF